MNLLDITVLFMLLSAAVGGLRIGFVARALSWGGIGVGLAIAGALLPRVLERFSDSPPLVLALLGVLVLLAGGSIGGAVGEAVGHVVRRAIPGPIRPLDRVGGAGAGALGVLVGLWLALPLMAEVPGAVSQQARTSAIGAFVRAVAPTPPDSIEQLRALVAKTRFPQVFSGLRPAPDTGPPPEQIPVPAAIVERAIRSTVNVEAVGCGEIHEGSGYAAAPNTIITNAHVVAGADRVQVLRPDGRRLTARVVVFDDNRDLAVLDVPGLGQTPLPLAATSPGAEGVVLGHPGGQDRVNRSPAAVREEVDVVGRDIYGEDRTRRRVLYLAARLRPGDSGGPLIDTQGRVIGVAFAIAPDRSATAYALADDEVRAVMAAPRTRGTGRCMR